MSKNDQLAFYINAYNAWILNEALGKYPTKSVKDTFFTFFTGKRIKVASQQTSFNALEKETIRSKFGDPRIHFALNCASKSCPPLLAGAFRGSSLESQMETLSRNFINTQRGVKFDEGAKTASSPRYLIGSRMISKRAGRPPLSTNAGRNHCPMT